MSLSTAAFAATRVWGSPSLRSGFKARACAAAWIGANFCAAWLAWQLARGQQAVTHCIFSLTYVRMHSSLAVPKPVIGRKTHRYAQNTQIWASEEQLPDWLSFLIASRTCATQGGKNSSCPGDCAYLRTGVSHLQDVADCHVTFSKRFADVHVPCLSMSQCIPRNWHLPLSCPGCQWSSFGSCWWQSAQDPHCPPEALSGLAPWCCSCRTHTRCPKSQSSLAWRATHSSFDNAQTMLRVPRSRSNVLLIAWWQLIRASCFHDVWVQAIHGVSNLSCLACNRTTILFRCMPTPGDSPVLAEGVLWPKRAVWGCCRFFVNASHGQL